jgi:imidazolonepropionase
MLIHSASQLLTLQGGPQRGSFLGRLGLIENGAVLVRGETIADVGLSNDLIKAYPHEPRLDAGGCAVLPGFVDPHTHVIWAGERSAEFEKKMAGATYLEILGDGGGILSTVRSTRQASSQTIKDETRPRLQRMFAHGTTTVEAKTGYGLDTSTELRLLDILQELQGEGPIDISPTFLGAHAIPPEYIEDSQGYTNLLCLEMLPAVRHWWEEQTRYEKHPRMQNTLRHPPFVDAFCETGAFDLEQSRQILTRARDLGFPLKIHADEFDNLGGASLAHSPALLLDWLKRITRPPLPSWPQMGSWRLRRTATPELPGVNQCSLLLPWPAGS